MAERRPQAAALVGVAALAVVAVALSRLWPGACDDAYISFVYLKSLVAGSGLTYNGDLVQGYTNPLWVLLLIPFALGGIAPPAAAIALGWLFGAGALVATYWLARRLGLPPWWALLPALLVALSVDFVYWIGKGLEAPLFVLLVTLTLGLALAPDLAPRHALAAGVTGGLAALCRPDGLLIAAIAALIMGARTRRLRFALIPAGLALLFLAPWLVFARLYYGDWLPNSYYAKAGAFSLIQLKDGLWYLLGLRRPERQEWLAGAAGGLVLYLILAFLLAVLIGGRRARPRWLCGAVLVWCGYVVVVGGDRLPGWRFLIPVFPAAMVAIVAFVHGARLLESPRARASGVLILLLPVLLIALRWQNPQRRQEARFEQYVQAQRRAIGLWLRDTAPPGAVVALAPSGTIPYLTGLRTIDTLGVNDYHIAHYGRRDAAGLPISEQVGDGYYVLSRRPDYILLGAAGIPLPCGWVTERELAADPRFWRDYRPLRVMLPTGVPFIIYKRVGES